MRKPENPEPRRRDSTSAVERRERLEATTQAAMATITTEAEARRAKTERLRVAREAAISRKADDGPGD